MTRKPAEVPADAVKVWSAGGRVETISVFACPVEPGSGVDIRGSEGTRAHLTPREWQALRREIRAGRWDDLYPDGEPGS